MSDDLKRVSVETFGEHPIEVVPNFICPSHFQREPNASFKEELSPSGAPVLCHISNFRPVKRVCDVVAMFALLRASKKAKLLMVGDGPDRAAAERRALELKVAEDVVFLGKVKNPIEPLLISDLLVLPSETESFGLVALEAFAAGVPVISTDVGGLPEVNLQGKTGMLRPRGGRGRHGGRRPTVLDSANFPGSKRLHLAGPEAFHIHKILPQYEAVYRRALPANRHEESPHRRTHCGQPLRDRWMATISGAIPDWQRQSLELWLGAWGALGAMLAYGVELPGGERQFYLICMGFWAFFAMRDEGGAVAQVGAKKWVQLSQDGLSIRLDHGEQTGKATEAPLEELKPAQAPEPNPKSFLESMDQQFWVVGGDRIHVGTASKTLVFGKQLEAKDATNSVTLFNQHLAQLKKALYQSLSNASAADNSLGGPTLKRRPWLQPPSSWCGGSARGHGCWRCAPQPQEFEWPPPRRATPQRCARIRWG